MSGDTFTVDTHLFRELGELLVGRDSTALVELIKNAYDADAKEVVVHGEQLDSAGNGRIVVQDNGTGMNEAQFREGFLRIASRVKEQQTRQSPIFRRRYTGAKGIGRLAGPSQPELNATRRRIVDTADARAESCAEEDSRGAKKNRGSYPPGAVSAR